MVAQGQPLSLDQIDPLDLIIASARNAALADLVAELQRQFPQTFCDRRPPPVRTQAIPGTPRKIDIMRERYARGEHLHHPEDARVEQRHFLAVFAVVGRNGRHGEHNLVAEGQ